MSYAFENNPKWLISLLEAIWKFGLLAWAYVVANIFMYPQWQLSNVSQYIPIPTNVFGIGAFGISFLAFFLWTWGKPK